MVSQIKGQNHKESVSVQSNYERKKTRVCFLVEVATERMKGFELFLSQRVVKTKPMQSPFNI